MLRGNMKREYSTCPIILGSPAENNENAESRESNACQGRAFFPYNFQMSYLNKRDISIVFDGTMS